MKALRRRLASWLLGDRDKLVEKMWPLVKTSGYGPRDRARQALDAILGQR